MKKNHKRPAPFAAAAEDRPISRIPEAALWGLLSVWGFFVFRAYSRVFPMRWDQVEIALSLSQYFAHVDAGFIRGWFWNMVDTLKLAWILAAAWAWGRLGLKLLKLEGLTVWEERLYGTGLGLGILMNAVLFLGLAGIFHKHVILLLLLASLGLLPWAWRARVLDIREVHPRESWSLLEIAAFAVLGAAVLVNYVMAFVPETFYDSLVYHLRVPDYFLRHGRVSVVPANFYSNMTLGMSMFYAIGLSLGNETLAKLIHFACGGLGFLCLWKLSRRHFAAPAGLLAAVSFATIPMTALNSWTAGTELGLFCFGVLMIFAALRGLVIPAGAAESSRNWAPDAPQMKRWLVLAGIFAGCGFEIKYPGAFGIMATGLVILTVGWERKRMASYAVAALVFGITSGVVYLPWAVRGLVFSGSPVFPYLHKWDPEIHQLFLGDIGALSTSGLANYLRLPWTVTMNNGGSANFTGPLFLLLFPLVFFFKRLPLVVRCLALYFLAHAFLWSFATSSARYLIPAFASAVLVVAYLVLEVRTWAPVEKILRAGVVAVAACNLYWILIMFYYGQGWQVVFNYPNMDKTSYLSQERGGYPGAYYGIVKWANENLPQDARVLFIGEKRGYYLERDSLVSTVYDFNPLWTWLSKSASADDLARTLREEKITHLMVSVKECVRLDKSYHVLRWDDRGMDVLDAFWKKNIKLLYAHNGSYLYEVLGGAASAGPAPPNILRVIDRLRKKQVAQCLDMFLFNAGYAMTPADQGSLMYALYHYKQISWTRDELSAVVANLQQALQKDPKNYLYQEALQILTR